MSTCGDYVKLRIRSVKNLNKLAIIEKNQLSQFKKLQAFIIANITSKSELARMSRLTVKAVRFLKYA